MSSPFEFIMKPFTVESILGLQSQIATEHHSTKPVELINSHSSKCLSSSFGKELETKRLTPDSNQLSHTSDLIYRNSLLNTNTKIPEYSLNYELNPQISSFLNYVMNPLEDMWPFLSSYGWSMGMRPAVLDASPTISLDSQGVMSPPLVHTDFKLPPNSSCVITSKSDNCSEFLTYDHVHSDSPVIHATPTCPHRNRTTFTAYQLLSLEREFKRSRYLTRIERIQMSHELKLSEKQIKIWFQNRRVRWRRQEIRSVNENS